MTQIITDAEGKPTFAVIPYNEYLALVEDTEDRALIAEANAEHGENVSLAEMRQIIEDELSPVAIFRERAAMTQAELATIIGSSAAYISQIETGKRHPGAAMRRKLAAALGVGVDDLA